MIFSIAISALMYEWHSACARLPREWAEELAPPQFALVPGLACWGQWKGGLQRRLELRQELIEHHPWYVVVDVLRHEIAHQVAEKFPAAAPEGPHGPHFQEICRMLRARSEASGDFPLLDQVILSEDDEVAATQEGALHPQARLAVKIRKLLSLATSANPAEAESALLKAREIAARYEIDLGRAAQHEPPICELQTIALGGAHNRTPLSEIVLANILQDFFRVLVVWQHVPDLTREGRFRRQMHISGAKKDLRIAAYVYDCLRSCIKRSLFDLPARLLARALTSKRAEEEFAVGVLQGFRSALEEQNKRPELQALVLSDRKHLDEYRARLYPRLSTNARKVSFSSPELRSAGAAAGRKIRLRPGIDGSGSASSSSGAQELPSH